MNKLSGVALLVALGGLSFGWSLLSWPAVKERIAKKFPEVSSLTTGELAARLADKSQAPPLLLDVRTAAEFEVSHLARARRVDPEAPATQLNVPKSTPIVTYCSVGYRSAAFAERLQAAGFSKVRNLEGSIFQWANEGRPMVNATGPTKLVHPYNSLWGQLLKAPLRAKTPAAAP